MPFLHMNETLEERISSAKSENSSGTLSNYFCSALCYIDTAIIGGFSFYMSTSTKMVPQATVTGGLMAVVAMPLMFFVGCYFLRNPSDTKYKQA
ncbi:MAG: hypothetical protein QXH80_00230 [Candidatus Nanoarchaeia archaeon]